jgi:hypothetical protein
MIFRTPGLNILQGIRRLQSFRLQLPNLRHRFSSRCLWWSTRKSPLWHHPLMIWERRARRWEWIIGGRAGGVGRMMAIMSRQQEARYWPRARCSIWRPKCVRGHLRGSSPAIHFKPILRKEKITTNGGLLIIDVLLELSWLMLSK